MIKVIVVTVLVSIASFAVIALGLVLSDQPGGEAPSSSGVFDFATLAAVDQTGLPASQTFQARDGEHLSYRLYASARPSGRLIILVHGSAWHGLQFHTIAKDLSERGLGTIIVPDMRGHGEAPSRRGDLDYIDQLEDDMADLIDSLARDDTDLQVILGGHSSGGGFVVRFAGGVHGDKADGFILLAPYLKFDAPTMRQNAGGWAQPAVRRFIGLAMLNLVGIETFNHLPVVSFKMPKAVLNSPYGHTATTVYSYRMNVGFSPRSDYEADLASMDVPLLVVSGALDEAFFADQFEPVISPLATMGTYHVLPGVTHLGLMTDPGVPRVLESWILSHSAD